MVKRRKPTTAPNITWPPVRGDVCIDGSLATGRKGYCERCRRPILEVEKTYGIYTFRTSKRWLHFEPNPACRGPLHKEDK